LAEDVLAEHRKDAAAGALATFGADGLEVVGAGGDRRGGVTVEVSDAEYIGSAALEGVVETAASIVGGRVAAAAAATAAALDCVSHDGGSEESND
jgi:hypothetical protein